ncbi:hypothetical protein COK67_19280 [Bacillus cereus]|uniref:hypothetical protein n=1 Tax=Bacillus cereus TaxID=1396 RepID=UPI000BF3875F|nr:hypothetical protein [Bacillus cereus]PFT62805.1 hypothetical protein COK67_19280 [Bacillus cereus]
MARTSKWDKIIQDLFSNKNTIYMATELIEFLCEKHGITNHNARQIIKRSVDKGLIKTSSPFTFQSGQYVYMDLKTNLNLEILLKISRKYKQSLYRLLWLFNEEEKIISMYEAKKIMGVPVENIERYKLVDFNKEISELDNNGILSIKYNAEKNIKYLISNDVIDESYIKNQMNLHFEKMSLDVLLIPDIIRWLKKHNFIDSNDIAYRRVDNPSIGAKHNDFLWDVYSYTNTTGFSIDVGNKDKQTLVVLDVLIHREYSQQDLYGFYSRIQSVRYSTHGDARKILPIIFYNEIDPKVKKEIQNLKILNFSIQDIFGIKVTEIINKLDAVKKLLDNQFLSLEEKSKDVVENIESTLAVMKDTGHTDNLQNLKGDLFESLMYVIVSNLYPYQGYRIMHSVNLKPYEYDIVVQGMDEIIVFELKGFKSKTIINLGDSSTKNTVRWFFAKTFPHAKDQYALPNHHYALDKSKIKGCYITSGQFSKEAKEKLVKINESNIKPTNLNCYYDRTSLLDLVRNHPQLDILRKSTNFVYLLERYYLEDK